MTNNRDHRDLNAADNHDDKVGYKRPPKEYQFQKNQPRPANAGRKKGSFNSSTIREILRRVLFEPVIVMKKKDGTPLRTISRYEAALTSGCDRATTKGSYRDLRTILDEVHRYLDKTEDPDDRLARMMKELQSY